MHFQILISWLPWTLLVLLPILAKLRPLPLFISFIQVRPYYTTRGNVHGLGQRHMTYPRCPGRKCNDAWPQTRVHCRITQEDYSRVMDLPQKPRLPRTRSLTRLTRSIGWTTPHNMEDIIKRNGCVQTPLGTMNGCPTEKGFDDAQMLSRMLYTQFILRR